MMREFEFAGRSQPTYRGSPRSPPPSQNDRTLDIPATLFQIWIPRFQLSVSYAEPAIWLQFYAKGSQLE